MDSEKKICSVYFLDEITGPCMVYVDADSLEEGIANFADLYPDKALIRARMIPAFE